MGEPVGAAIAGIGLAQSVSSHKRAKKEYKRQEAAQKQEQQRVAVEQSKLDAELTRKREKTAQGIARANRRRTKGAIFKTDTNQPVTTSKFLGG